MVLRVLLSLYIALYLFVSCAGAVTENGSAQSSTDASEVAAYPGLSELGAKSAEVSEFVAKSQDQLAKLEQLDALKEGLTAIEGQFDKLSQEIAPLGEPESWYVDRLMRYNRQFQQLQHSLDMLQEDLAMRQQQTDLIRGQIDADREFWSGWAADLKDRQLEIPSQILDQVTIQLKQLDSTLRKVTSQLLQVQERSGHLQTDLMATLDGLKFGLEKLRQATFRKNAHSFFSSRFYEQFDGELMAQMRKGFVAMVMLDWAFIGENSSQLGLMMALFVTIASLISFYRKRFERTEDWQFVLYHPFAVATFLAVILFWNWSSALPPLVLFILQAGAVAAALVLATSLAENTRQARVLCLAGGVFLVTSGLRMASLPQPLLRIYIALLALVFIPLLIQQISLSRKQRGTQKGRLFRALLRSAVLVLSLSLIAQAAGYINFSSWLIQATFQTGLLILFLRMILMLIGGAIDVTMNLLRNSGRSFFVKYGRELADRIKWQVTVVLVFIALLNLLPVWRLFTTLNEAWEALTQFGFTIGETSVTVKMIGLALISFYIAMQISWFLQAMSETHLFAPRAIDRGVREAVKKLIHYGVVLVGFLVALGFLGMRLQNFIVLLGAFGVGIGFGLQDIVNNFLSGLILLFERPIKVGDGILIDDEYGVVTRIGLRSTVVENLNQAELIVPNSQIISQKVTNWTHSNRGVRLVLAVGVAYGSDLEKVLKVLRETAQDHPDVLTIPEPMPLFTQFGASSLDFELRVWIPNVDDRPRVQNELLLAIDRRFREEHIEIPFPQRDLHLRSVAAGIIPNTSVDES